MKSIPKLKIDDAQYDCLEIMTTLGSNLKFQKQTIEVIGLDQAIISDYTTGDKIENGQTKVEMNDDYFEIYVEVSEREYRNGTQRIWS